LNGERSISEPTFDVFFANQESQEYFKRNYTKYFEPTPACHPQRNFVEEMLKFQESHQFSVSSLNSAFFNKEFGEMAPSFLERIPIKYKGDFTFL
jgi:hypothetical protein